MGGISADYLDFDAQLSAYLPIIFVFILGVSFILLLVVFRSIVIPIKAIIMNLLSVGAAYGLMVLVFQKGVGADLFGFQQIETIEAWLPLILFAILFGLSMDYHVFMLSRIRERYDQTHDNAESVAYGLRSTAGLITGAALIMVAVFSGFAAGDHGRQPAGGVRARGGGTAGRDTGAEHPRSSQHATAWRAELVPARIPQLAAAGAGGGRRGSRAALAEEAACPIQGIDESGRPLR